MATSEVDVGRHSVEALLAEWRAAERHRDQFEHGSPVWLEADLKVDELRHEYHDAIESRVRRGHGESLAS